jgi:hypothetical protein
MARQVPVPNEDEAAELACCHEAIRDAWKPWIVSCVIGVLGVWLGSRGGYEGYWGLLYFIGVFALLPALGFTLWIVWEGAPVIVAKSPEPWRPLANIGVFLLWVSVPLWIYKNAHPERQIRFLGLLDYVEVHGYLVAGLFILGIIAFGYGRSAKTRSHYGSVTGAFAIRPYLVIPIAILILAYLLHPDDDGAIAATGLTVGLVYYVWGVISASIGFLLGRAIHDMKAPI